MMNRHAYLILAHTNPGQLRKLLEMLDDARNDIYVHIDAKAGFGEKELEGCCGKSGLFFIKPRIRANWGGYSLARIEIALLEKATEKSYDYYHLLSGMDLPIKSQDHIHNFFDRNRGKEFINLWTIKDNTRSRFNCWSPFPEGGGNFILNFLNNAAKGFQLMTGIRINRDVEFKYGSQWFSITDGMARFAVSQKEWLDRTFRHTTTCDEVFMPTLVWKSPFRENIYDPEEHTGNSTADNLSNMRFIDWTRGKSVRHPWVFTIDDYDLLKGLPHFWARKFDERVDSAIIDRIEESLKA